MSLRITYRPDIYAASRAWLRERCKDGLLPAELLDTEDREWLVRLLYRRWWTDAEIAAHTFMTTYTTARIRERIGLPAHPPRVRSGAG